MLAVFTWILKVSKFLKLNVFVVVGNMNGGYVPEDARSHISQMSTRSRARSMADGRSEHGLFSYQAKYNSSRNGKNLTRGVLFYCHGGGYTPLGLFCCKS